MICVCKHMLTKLCDFCVFSYRPTFDIIHPSARKTAHGYTTTDDR
ncbi:hypothetical protein [Moraxella lacunata]